jgi:hypothetical protein
MCIRADEPQRAKQNVHSQRRGKMEGNVLNALSRTLEAEVRRLASSAEGLYAATLYYPSYEYMGSDTSLLGLYTDEATALRASAQYLTEKTKDLKGLDNVPLGVLSEEESWVGYVRDTTYASSRNDLTEYVVVRRLPADTEIRVWASLAGWA